MNRQEIIHIIKKHQDELSDVYGVKSLALFGSVARDQAFSFSDVDLLV
jgi:predicted nucleotidyltransferase